MKSEILRISLAHISPISGDIRGNRKLIEKAIKTAAEFDSDWLLTPELSVSGYEFSGVIGTDWILPQPDEWLSGLCSEARQNGLTLFIAIPERDDQTGLLHNSVFLIDEQGSIAGRHRKIKVLPGFEGWSSAGSEVEHVNLNGLKVGILVCADCYSPGLAGRLVAGGAQLLVSAANWGPGLHGPEGEWEARTLETNLPLIVCNRTGSETQVDFRRAQSLFLKDGEKILAFESEESTLLTFDLDLQSMTPLSTKFQTRVL